MRYCEELSNLTHGAIMRLLRAKSPRNDGLVFLMVRNDDEVFRGDFNIKVKFINFAH